MKIKYLLIFMILSLVLIGGVSAAEVSDNVADNSTILNEVSQDFWNMFQVVIQFGAILAVVLLYFKKIWPFTTGLFPLWKISRIGRHFLPGISRP